MSVHTRATLPQHGPSKSSLSMALRTSLVRALLHECVGPTAVYTHISAGAAFSSWYSGSRSGSFSGPWARMRG